MALQFGKTWWGEHWLRSLTDVDYDNRLPRGATYARNGSVTSLFAKGNHISARVAGRRKQPYRVSLTVPPFFQDDINSLIAAIKQRPALIADLLNRNLSPELLDIAESCGLKVFPEKWTDLKMSCSCPDWAVPCKHIAAVIYTLSREIDNNPFLVFEMRQVDLPAELQQQGIFFEEKQAAIPKLTALLPTTRKKRKADDPDAIYSPVDYSTLVERTSPLIELLPEAPPFYGSGDFRKKYATRLVRAVKTAKRVLRGRLSMADALHLDRTGTDIEGEINRRLEVTVAVDGDNRIELAGEKLPATDFDTFIIQLFHLNPDYLPDYQPSIAALHKALLASLALLQSGNVIPEIVKGSGRSYLLRWLPAQLEPTVCQLVEQLEELLNFDLLHLKKTVKGKTTLQRLQQQAEALLSLFLTRLISSFSQTAKENKDDLIEDFFFKNRHSSFSGVGEKALAGGIKAWIDRYHITTCHLRPLVMISEQDSGLFTLSISFEERENPDTPPVELATILDDERYSEDRFQILPALTRLTPFIKGLNSHIDAGGSPPIPFSIEEMAPFIRKLLPAITLLGIQVVLPKSLQELLRPKISLQLRKKEGTPASIRLDHLFSFDWRVAIGDQVLSAEEFSTLLDKASGLFRFKERYFYADEEELLRLQKQLTADTSLSRHQLLQAALSEEYEGAKIILTPEARALIDEISTIREMPAPAGLQATLRPYQQRGYQWMYHNSRIGFGSLIADDMGLGKTLQVIALLLKLKEESPKGKFLVVVPTGLLANWQAELARFAPQLSFDLYHGPERKLQQADGDILLTSYGVARSDAEKLKKKKWQVVVIDEAQNIKNKDAAQSKAVKSIGADIRIAMSGTPVENRLGEFWSIMDYTNKGYLGSTKSFKENYADPIQIANDAKVAEKFRDITAPFIMRRMKSDKTIISDLPDKVEQNQWALLTRSQAALYEKTMMAAMDEIEGVSDQDSLFKRQGLILQMILALKQICNHPTNFLKNNNLDPVLSGKTTLLFELLDAILNAGEKTLIFTQFKEMGALLEQFIAARYDEAPLFYHGGCSIQQRKEMVDRFQENRAERIFILSLKAAGTGLNLTAASQVIHYDLWWNPAVENQATDRAYRIGQQKKVIVHRLITRNTFEEKIDAMIQQKKALAEMTVATGEKWLGKLSNRELREIFS